MLRSSEPSSTAGDHVGAAGAQTVIRGEESEFTSDDEGGWESPPRKNSGRRGTSVALRAPSVATNPIEC